MSEDLHTQHLRTFLELVKRGSVLGAAEALGVSRATVRRRVQHLEASVGSPLFASNVPGLTLTAAGRVAESRGRDLLRDGAAWLRAVRGASGGGTELRAVLPTGMPLSFQAQLVGALQRQFPDTRWSFREAEDPLEHLHEPADAILCFGPAPTRGDFYARVVRRARLVLMGMPAYLDRVGRPTCLDDLAAHPIAAWRAPGLDPGQLRLRAGGTHTIVPHVVSASPALLRSVALLGTGLVYLPDGGVFEQPETANLETVLGDVVYADVPFRVLLRRPTVSDPEIAEIVGALRALLERVPLPKATTP